MSEDTSTLESEINANLIALGKSKDLSEAEKPYFTLLELAEKAEKPVFAAQVQNMMADKLAKAQPALKKAVSEMVQTDNWNGNGPVHALVEEDEEVADAIAAYQMSPEFIVRANLSLLSDSMMCAAETIVEAHKARSNALNGGEKKISLVPQILPISRVRPDGRFALAIHTRGRSVGHLEGDYRRTFGPARRGIELLDEISDEADAGHHELLKCRQELFGCISQKALDTIYSDVEGSKDQRVQQGSMVSNNMIKTLDMLEACVETYGDASLEELRERRAKIEEKGYQVVCDIQDHLYFKALEKAEKILSGVRLEMIDDEQLKKDRNILRGKQLIGESEVQGKKVLMAKAGDSVEDFFEAARMYIDFTIEHSVAVEESRDSLRGTLQRIQEHVLNYAEGTYVAEKVFFDYANLVVRGLSRYQKECEALEEK